MTALDRLIPAPAMVEVDHADLAVAPGLTTASRAVEYMR